MITLGMARGLVCEFSERKMKKTTYVEWTNQEQFWRQEMEDLNAKNWKKFLHFDHDEASNDEMEKIIIAPWHHVPEQL